MLQGKKPLAAFADMNEWAYIEEIIPEKSFAPHVVRGAIIKREQITGEPPRQLRRVFYVLPGQEWRINAYLLLWEIAEKTGWNESLERMQGRLLGYDELQCDFHIKHYFKKHSI